MINKITLKNFGPLHDAKWKGLANLNLIIGGNGSGKTFLLKSMYSAMRSIEAYRRGDSDETTSEILVKKLRWTFQNDKIGDLVKKGVEGNLRYEMHFDGHHFLYTFGRDTTKQISNVENNVPKRESNSIFLPAKEVLSLLEIILKSREDDRVFGFDDTYLDLARALRQSGKGGKNYAVFAESRKNLENMLGGKIEDKDGSGNWLFKEGKYRYPLGVTAEGVKKVAILDTLLCNRFLDTQSVIFIDEIESALHPTAISEFLDIIAALASCGIQFFISSHSYFVVKKLFLIAQEKGISIPVLSAEGREWSQSDLRDEMPINSIISESIRLYEKEVELSFS
jgi:AAA15 family ATPase/GTPase